MPRGIKEPFVNHALSAQGFARVVGCSVQWVYQLTTLAVLKPNENSYYPIDPNFKAYLEHKISITKEGRRATVGANGASGASSLSLTEAKTRISTIRADLEEMEYERVAGNLLAADIVIDVLSQIFMTEKHHLLAMPSKLASRLSTITDPMMISRILEKEVNDALYSLDLETVVAEIKSKVDRNGASGTGEADIGEHRDSEMDEF